MADILEGFDESEVGEAVGEVAIKVRREDAKAAFSVETLSDALQSLPHAARQNPATVVLGGRLFEVTGVTREGVLEVEELPF